MSRINVAGVLGIEMVRRTTGVYRMFGNQHGGGHIRDSVVRFLEGGSGIARRPIRAAGWAALSWPNVGL